MEKEWHARSWIRCQIESGGRRNLRGAQNAGAVLFESVPGGIKVTLKLAYEPDGAAETVGDAPASVSRRVEGRPRALQGVHRESAAGHRGRRGEIHGRDVRPIAQQR